MIGFTRKERDYIIKNFQFTYVLGLDAKSLPYLNPEINLNISTRKIFYRNVLYDIPHK